uniref:Reverse transcriptase domain-containing protein n=1 Tax=Angiostrongylus cantonensis TaxID=6313 RepID=A0A0K0DCT8_ANGCA
MMKSPYWGEKVIRSHGKFLLNLRFVDDIFVSSRYTNEAETITDELNEAFSEHGKRQEGAIRKEQLGPHSDLAKKPLILQHHVKNTVRYP